MGLTVAISAHDDEEVEEVEEEEEVVVEEECGDEGLVVGNWTRPATRSRKVVD